MSNAKHAKGEKPFDLAAALKAHGCYQADGGTEHALKAFQARNGIARTGKMDAATKTALAR